MNTLGPLIPIPKDLLTNPQQIAEYEEAEKLGPAAVLAKFKWWSMHDLMTKYHEGLMPKENNANFLKFAVDFSSDELNRAKTTDPSLPGNIDMIMTPGLQKKSNEIQNIITSMREQNANQNVQNISGALTLGRRGGKKVRKMKGGLFEMGAPPPQPGAFPPAPMDPNMPAAFPGALPAAAPAEPPELPYSAKSLETECLNDLVGLALTSKERIFITDGVLPTLQQGGRKTRRGKKKAQKRRKTRKTRKY